MTAWINGQAVVRDEAVAAAAALLAGARSPVFAGLCAETAAVQAAFDLARVIGASLDPVAGSSLYADLGALASGGAMTTTPAEARGRADLVLALGAAPWASDIVTELAAEGPVRGRAAGRSRTLLALGGGGDGAVQHIAYPAGEAGLAAAIGLLRGLVAGRIAGPHPLADLAARLREALYGVVLYDPAEIGALGAEMLNGLVKDLNETTRCFALPLGDPYQGRAVAQVAAWSTGQGPRVGYGRGHPEHDPWRFDAERQAAAGEVDAALWLASLPAPLPTWIRTVPTVALLGEPKGDEARVVIGVGVPGEALGAALWHPRRAAIAWQEPRQEPRQEPQQDPQREPGSPLPGISPAAAILAELQARLAASPAPHPERASC
ncbi:formyltransferase [Methylobacterium frigidaeris]|uniref:Formyltransferase/hydrolase complex Fhc subunit B n=1 Tax=Methylobacterium frigidaeris TaxID=2038277 RepID=A0AA37H7E9_9HYPH|nr:formyltransferase [Methylobacterium frigidaeris]PIK73125.1 formyltransferase [Methylobacterium frigidaeris]GJD60602.1 Formyltransferase/hydrolase complex Fhc subunit B [Methylobacterium frigidaeris]